MVSTNDCDQYQVRANNPPRFLLLPRPRIASPAAVRSLACLLRRGTSLGRGRPPIRLYPRFVPRPLPSVSPRSRLSHPVLLSHPQEPVLAPVRDPLRDLVVAMRKRNLSVYDIQRELAGAGQTVSINTLTLLLRQEGFARLPRRLDEERPQALRPEPAAVADVRTLSLAPRSFRTRAGGLFLFLPVMQDIRLGEVVRQVGLPGSAMIPAEQAVRSLLALKLLGTERKSHVMNLVCDEGIALFAGLNAVPKRSYLAAYSSRVDHRLCLRLLEAWSNEVHRAGLPRGSSIDLSQPRHTSTLLLVN